MEFKEKIGIIDVGGGLRGIYPAGIFDYLLDNDIHIPYCLGISAGSANVASYISRQKGRNKVFFQEYSSDRKYMSIWNLITKGSFVDLDYIYGTLSNEGGKNPWDFDKAIKSEQEMVVQMGNAKTGKADYIYKKDFKKNNYGFLCASSCIPIVCKPYTFNGVEYYDGGVVDPIPYKKAFGDGCTRVIVVLTRPRDFRRTLGRDSKSYKKLQNKYPEFVKALYNRPTLYNSELEEIINDLEPQGKVLLIAPDDICGMGTLTKDKAKLQKLYEKGYKDGEKIKEWLENI